ncbi:MAG TPA: DUF819 family protein [Gammaproteobacteria bacterium]|nr:DUF819 family protein [Gammaproteobacteria bacterium]
MQQSTALITSDTVIFGLLAATLGLIFYTTQSEHPFWKRFYSVVPALLLCYFIPALYNSFGLIDGGASDLYYMASRYLLPAALLLLTLSIDLEAIARLGGKAVIMFLTGTFGVIIGGPIAILIFSVIAPDVVGGAGPEAVWRGMTTIAGSWIGGGANQAAMKEVFEVDNNLFGQMVAVDVIIANIWMAVLLFMAARADKLDRKIHADTSGIEFLRKRVEAFEAEHSRIPKLHDLMYIIAIAFGFTGLAHAIGNFLGPWIGAHAPMLSQFSLDSSFFWLVVLATTFGLLLSFTRLKRMEGAGASKVGSVFIYVLVATIGMHMDIKAIASNPGLFAVGAVWMVIHAGLMLLVARLIRAPTFYMAVGSQANIGGAASAPVVAAAFHPSLAPVGVLLAVFGYALGTYGAYICGQLMRIVSGG